MKKSFIVLFVVLFGGLGLVQATQIFASSTPVISQLSPSLGPVGTVVTLTGSQFTNSGNTVAFGGDILAAQNVSSSDGTSLQFTVPTALNPLCYYSTPRCAVSSSAVSAGSYPITVTNANGTSNAVNFTVTSSGLSSPAPAISQMTPTSGQIGSMVRIVGTGFLSSGIKVNFAGSPIDTTFIDNYNLSFMVPSQVTGGCQAPLTCPSFIKPITSGNGYEVFVSNANGVSNKVNFAVTGASSYITLSDGNLVQIAGSLTVYLVQNGILHPFTSAAAFSTRGLSWSNVQQVAANQINPQTISTSPVLLPDGSVAKGSAQTVFIIYSGKRYGIPSEDVFFRLGLSFNNVVAMSDEELQSYADGGIQY